MVKAKIILLDPKNRKIGLSMKLTEEVRKPIEKKIDQEVKEHPTQVKHEDVLEKEEKEEKEDIEKPVKETSKKA
jgi:predicted RNA-binding protein with RPS1 domain